MKTVLRMGITWSVIVAAMTGLTLAQAAQQPQEAKAGQAATQESRGQEPKNAAAAGPAAVPAVFDTSAQFVPPHQLRVIDRPAAADAANLAQAEQGISVTPDGKVERIPLPPGLEAAFREMLKKLEAAPAKKGGEEEPVIRPESVIGEDTRVQVTNTTAYPYRTVGRIDIGCTGTLIGTRHVLTAC
jgi:glutamyl endopeptidase